MLARTSALCSWFHQNFKQKRQKKHRRVEAGPIPLPEDYHLVKAKASFVEGVDRVGKTLEAATELVNQTLQQLHAQEHGHREQYEAELKELRRVRAVLSTFAGAEIDAAVQSPERGAPLAGVAALGG